MKLPLEAPGSTKELAESDIIIKYENKGKKGALENSQTALKWRYERNVELVT